MADDIWAEYRDKPKELPPIVNEGTKRFSRPLKEDDPWKDYRAQKEIKIPEEQNATSNTENLGRLSVSPQRLLALSKGIPGLGHFLPEPNLAKSDPGPNTTLNIAGNVMAMGAPAAKVSSTLAARGAPGLFPEIAGQSALGIGVNTGDKFAEKGFSTSKENMKDSIISGLMQGTAGPLLGKAISPTFNSNRKTVEQLAKLSEDELHRVLVPNRAKETINAVLSHPITTGFGGAALGALTGGLHPILGGLAGATIPSVVKAGGKVMSNKLAHDMDTQAVINALMQAGGTQYNR